jgi:hypothetical protein
MAERRPAPRSRVLLTGILCYENGAHSFRCTIRDLSETGARVTLPPNLVVPKPVYLIDLRSRLAYQAERMWSDHKWAGLKFLRRIELDRLEDKSLTYLKRLLDAADTR